MDTTVALNEENRQAVVLKEEEEEEEDEIQHCFSLLLRTSILMKFVEFVICVCGICYTTTRSVLSVRQNLNKLLLTLRRKSLRTILFGEPISDWSLSIKMVCFPHAAWKQEQE